MTEIRTVDSIMETLNSIVAEKQPMSPHYWVEAAKYLNVLIGDETNKLCEMEQQVAQARVDARKTVKTVADANLIVEASDLYCDTRKLKGKIDQVQEFIRICKLSARLSNDEIKNY
jgi:hypothetical protein